jgi:hypothetical protein
MSPILRVERIPSPHRSPLSTVVAQPLRLGGWNRVQRLAFPALYYLPVSTIRASLTR